MVVEMTMPGSFLVKSLVAGVVLDRTGHQDCSFTVCDVGFAGVSLPSGIAGFVESVSKELLF